jgi:hypothetical protein
VPGLAGRPEQPTDHGGEGADRVELGLRPGARVPGDDVAGAQDPPGQADRRRQHAPDLVAARGRRQPRPPRVGPQIGRPRHLVQEERIDAGPFTQVALRTLERLLGLAGGRDPAKDSCLVGEHEPGAVGRQQQRRSGHHLVQRAGQVVNCGHRPRRRRWRADLAVAGGRVGQLAQQPPQLPHRARVVPVDAHRRRHPDRPGAASTQLQLPFLRGLQMLRPPQPVAEPPAVLARVPVRELPVREPAREVAHPAGDDIYDYFIVDDPAVADDRYAELEGYEARPRVRVYGCCLPISLGLLLAVLAAVMVLANLAIGSL